MDLREALDAAMEKKDLARAQAMATDVRARHQAALGEAAGALRALEGGAPADGGQALVKKASHALGRVRYFTRFLEQVEQFEEEALA